MTDFEWLDSGPNCSEGHYSIHSKIRTQVPPYIPPAFWSPNGGVGSNPTPDTAFFFKFHFFGFGFLIFLFFSFFLSDLRTKTLAGGSNSLAHVFFFFISFFFYRLGVRNRGEKVPFQSPGFLSNISRNFHYKSWL